MFKYIIKGDHRKALAVHSGMNWLEFTDYVRKRSVKLHPDGSDRVFRWGGVELVNPEVMSMSDYIDFLPALIGISIDEKPERSSMKLCVKCMHHYWTRHKTRPNRIKCGAGYTMRLYDRGPENIFYGRRNCMQFEPK